MPAIPRHNLELAGPNRKLCNYLSPHKTDSEGMDDCPRDEYQRVQLLEAMPAPVHAWQLGSAQQ